MRDKDEVRFLLRAPRSLYEAIRALADRDRRSINAQILCMLERYVAEDEDDGQRRPAAERR